MNNTDKDKCSHCGHGYDVDEFINLQMAIQECKKMKAELKLNALKKIKEFINKDE
jgi:hypothetical protein